MHLHYQMRNIAVFKQKKKINSIVTRMGRENLNLDSPHKGEQAMR